MPAPTTDPRADPAADAALEGRRLARNPTDPDGLQPGKMGERDGGTPDRHSSVGAKPYTTEEEAYRNGPTHGPEHPVDP